MEREISLDNTVQQSLHSTVGDIANLDTPINLGEGATEEDECSAEECRHKLAQHSSDLSGTLGEAFECHASEKISAAKIETAIARFDPETLHKIATELNARNLLKDEDLRLVEESAYGCDREQANRIVAAAMISSFGELKSLIAVSRILANDPAATSFRARLLAAIIALEAAIKEAQDLTKEFQRRELLPKPEVDQQKSETERSPHGRIVGGRELRPIEYKQDTNIEKFGSALQHAARQVGVRLHLLQIQDQINVLREEVRQKEVAINIHPGDDYPLICQRNAAQIELDGKIKEAEQWGKKLYEAPVLAI